MQLPFDGIEPRGNNCPIPCAKKCPPRVHYLRGRETKNALSPLHDVGKNQEEWYLPIYQHLDLFFLSVPIRQQICMHINSDLYAFNLQFVCIEISICMRTNFSLIFDVVRSLAWRICFMLFLSYLLIAFGQSNGRWNSDRLRQCTSKRKRSDR